MVRDKNSLSNKSVVFPSSFLVSCVYVLVFKIRLVQIVCTL